MIHQLSINGGKSGLPALRSEQFLIVLQSLLSRSDLYESNEQAVAALSYSITCQGQYKVKSVLLQAWGCPEGSTKLRFPDFMTTAQVGGKIVSLTHRPPLPQKMLLVLISVKRPSRPQGHSAIGRILSKKNSNDTN